MDAPWIPEKSNILFRDGKNVPIILAYEWSPEGKPSAMFVYFGNKEYKELLWTFSAERYGRERVEKYWSRILELDKNKILTLDSLCNTIENTFIPEEVLKIIKNKRKIKAN